MTPQDISLYIVSIVFIAYGAYHIANGASVYRGALPLVIGIFLPFLLPKVCPYFTTCIPASYKTEKISLGEMTKLVSATLPVV
jgi:hypothetical protein